MTTAVNHFRTTFNRKSSSSKIEAKNQESVQPKKNNGVLVTAAEGDVEKRDKELQQILKEKFSIPVSIENETIGYAKAVEFVKFVIKKEARESSNYIKFSSEEDTITVTYIWPYRTSEPYIGPGDRSISTFFFIKELVSDNYRKDASFHERLMRSGEKIASLFNFNLLSNSYLEDLVRDFDGYIKNHAEAPDIFTSYKAEEIFQGTPNDQAYPEDRFKNEFKYRTRPATLAKTVYLSSRINHNLNLMDVKFIKTHSTVKLRGFDKELCILFLKDNLFNKNLNKKQIDNEEWVMKKLKLTQEDKELLKRQMLKLVNYSDDSHELQAYVNSNKKIKNKKVFSYAELSSVTPDTIYGPYRSSKLVKEFRNELSGVENNTYFYESLMKVNPDKAIEILPEMGKYFIDNITDEQRAYVNTIIKSLANKLSLDSTILDDSLTDEAIISKAKELVELARYQNKESSLIYGRKASSLFLGISESKLELMEKANYDSVIEHGKTLDNILTGLVVGLMKKEY